MVPEPSVSNRSKASRISCVHVHSLFEGWAPEGGGVAEVRTGGPEEGRSTSPSHNASMMVGLDCFLSVPLSPFILSLAMERSARPPASALQSARLHGPSFGPCVLKRRSSCSSCCCFTNIRKTTGRLKKNSSRDEVRKGSCWSTTSTAFSPSLVHRAHIMFGSILGSIFKFVLRSSR